MFHLVIIIGLIKLDWNRLSLERLIKYFSIQKRASMYYVKVKPEGIWELFNVGTSNGTQSGISRSKIVYSTTLKITNISNTWFIIQDSVPIDNVTIKNSKVELIILTGIVVRNLLAFPSQSKSDNDLHFPWSLILNNFQHFQYCLQLFQLLGYTIQTLIVRSKWN